MQPRYVEIRRRQVKEINKEKLAKDISDYNWDDLLRYESPEEMYNKFSEVYFPIYLTKTALTKLLR